MKSFQHLSVFRVILVDLVLLNLINWLFVTGVKGYQLGGTGYGGRYLLLLVILNMLWIFINTLLTRYKMDLGRGFAGEIKKLLVNITIFTGIVSIFAFIFKALTYSRIIVYGTLFTFAVCTIISHAVLLKILKYWKRKESKGSRILIAGDDRHTVELCRELSGDKELDYEIILYMEVNEETPEALPARIGDAVVLTGKLSGAAELFSQYKIHELYIAVSSPRRDVIEELLETADYHGARVRMVPLFHTIYQPGFTIKTVGDIPIVTVNEIPLDNYYNALFKRIFDIVFSSLVLLLLSPLYLLISLLIKISGRGPVFYVPGRVGLDGEVFKMYKFRTMQWSPQEDETKSTSPNDSRITPLGKFLRKYGLDELPQFFNVLTGRMSVVGPRPHRVYLGKKLQEVVDKYMLRHYVKPGITGWAQVNGWRGPTETEEQKEQRTRHDLWYIKHWTFLLDLRIILLTMFGKKTRKNAF